jgi:hypothetical protein
LYCFWDAASIHILYTALVKLNKINNNNKSPAANDKEKKQEEAIPPPPLLKTLEDMLYNRIAQKKREIHKATERAVTDKLWTEIEKHCNRS